MNYRLTNSADKVVYREIEEVARNMRRNPTRAEAKLWMFLERNQLGVRFRRQHVIDRFIVDFLCFEHSLVVEVDGDIHDLQIDRDRQREDILKTLGYRILRFRNEQVIQDIQSVIYKIRNEIKFPQSPL